MKKAIYFIAIFFFTVFLLVTSERVSEEDVRSRRYLPTCRVDIDRRIGVITGGTGFRIEDRADKFRIVTAKHLFVVNGSIQSNMTITLVFGRVVHENGTATFVFALSCRLPDPEVILKFSKSDAVMIEIPSKPFRKDLNKIGYLQVSERPGEGSLVNIIGFPDDTLVLSSFWGKVMTKEISRARAYPANVILYKDLALEDGKGLSGGPVLDQSGKACAVHFGQDVFPNNKIAWKGICLTDLLDELGKPPIWSFFLWVALGLNLLNGEDEINIHLQQIYAGSVGMAIMATLFFFLEADDFH